MTTDKPKPAQDAKGRLLGLPDSREKARAVGAKYFFTGAACKRGHIAKRDTYGNHCVECQYQRLKARDAARPEGEKQEKWRAWYDENRDRRNAQKRARNWSPKDSGRWQKANPDKAKDCYKRYYLKNKEKFREKVRNRAARSSGAEGSHTQADVVSLLASQSGKCVYCRVSFGPKYHVDHVVPLSAGGSNDKTNLQILCAPCNLSKGAKHPIEFAQRIGLLL